MWIISSTWIWTTLCAWMNLSLNRHSFPGHGLYWAPHIRPTSDPPRMANETKISTIEQRNHLIGSHSTVLYVPFGMQGRKKFWVLHNPYNVTSYNARILQNRQRTCRIISDTSLFVWSPCPRRIQFKRWIIDMKIKLSFNNLKKNWIE